MRRRAAILFAFLLTLSTACGSDGPATAASSPLRVGIIPNIAPDQQRARYQPLGDYLSTRLGRPVELFVASNYAGVVTALAAGQLDVAYLGGLTYAQAEKQVPLVPVVTEVDRDTGTTRYLSAIVVRADSPLKSTRDLVAKGGSFAFGDPSSTSGSLYPRLMLDAAGARCSTTTTDSCPPLSSVRFTGGHDATALAVAGGRVDAGGVELRILRRLEKAGTVKAGALRMLESRPVMGYPWVVRTTVGQPTIDAVRDAFLALDDPTLLDLLRAEDYAAVGAADYEEVRREATRLGLLK